MILNAAALLFIPPTARALDSQSILALSTLERYGTIPASKTSINRSNSSEPAPDGCCQANMSMDATVSSTPRHRGAASTRKVEGMILGASLLLNNNAVMTFGRVCKFIMASAEHEVRDPKTSPADSRIREDGVSLVELAPND